MLLFAERLSAKSPATTTKAMAIIIAMEKRPIGFRKLDR